MTKSYLHATKSYELTSLDDGNLFNEFNFSIQKSGRSILKGHKPCVLWFTGFSGAGKSTIANIVEKKLIALQLHTYLLDGDNLRQGLNKDLGFCPKDRIENIRRVGEVSKLFVDAGLIVLCAFISPFRAERQMVRQLVAEKEFVEIFVDTALEVCIERDPKGLYKKAQEGALKNFTGIDSPYERPESPEIVIDTAISSPERLADQIIDYLRQSNRLVDSKLKRSDKITPPAPCLSGSA